MILGVFGIKWFEDSWICLTGANKNPLSHVCFRPVLNSLWHQSSDFAGVRDTLAASGRGLPPMPVHILPSERETAGPLST